MEPILNCQQIECAVNSCDAVPASEFTRGFPGTAKLHAVLAGEVVRSPALSPRLVVLRTLGATTRYSDNKQIPRQRRAPPEFGALSFQPHRSFPSTGTSSNSSGDGCDDKRFVSFNQANIRFSVRR